MKCLLVVGLISILYTPTSQLPPFMSPNFLNPFGPLSPIWPPNSKGSPGPPQTPIRPSPPHTPVRPGPPQTPIRPSPPHTPVRPGPPQTPIRPGPPPNWNVGSLSVPVKVTKIDTLVSSSQYFSEKSTISVTYVNQTYNAVKLDLTVNVNIPVQTKVVIKVLQSSSHNGVYTSINQGWSFQLTDTRSIYHRLLPPELIQEIAYKGTLSRGRLVSNDYGYFKFYELLSVSELRHRYYKMVYSYEVNSQTILTQEHRFQSLSIQGIGC